MAESERKLKRSYRLMVRTYPETHDQLVELQAAVSRRLGTDVTQAQVLEMLVADALRKEQEEQ